jgi:hypothetical protein
LRQVSGRRRWWPRRLGFAGAEADPADFAGRALAAIEERLMWGRFGL